MTIASELKAIEKAEKNLHKAIDDEKAIEDEIVEVANIAASSLTNKPMAPIEFQGRFFILMASIFEDKKGSKCMQIISREKTEIITPNSKVIKANFEIDIEYSKRENLVTGIKALLGHISGVIKPEKLD